MQASQSKNAASRRRGACLLLLLLLLGMLPVARAQTEEAPLPRPAWLFLQLGGNAGAVSATVGAGWALGWQRETRWGPLDSRLEFSMGRWRSDGTPGEPRHRTSQLGLMPLLRLRPPGWWPGWGIEAGIGVDLLNPAYQRAHKRFSTRYNFGEQLGLVYQAGAAHELSLRLQHDSNAGLRKPNPGENFLQLRYAYRL